MSYIYSLGDCVKQARVESKLTQSRVAELAGIDAQTVLHIENYRSNPKMSVLFPLVRALKIDPRCIFYPELEQRGEAAGELDLLLAGCTDEQIRALLPLIRAALEIVKSRETVALE